MHNGTLQVDMTCQDWNCKFELNLEVETHCNVLVHQVDLSTQNMLTDRNGQMYQCYLSFWHYLLSQFHVLDIYHFAYTCGLAGCWNWSLVYRFIQLTHLVCGLHPMLPRNLSEWISWWRRIESVGSKISTVRIDSHCDGVIFSSVRRSML